MDSSTDRIERRIHINAPRAKVWRALNIAEEFGKWFGVDFNNKTFEPGQHTQGQIAIPGYRHILMDILIVRMEPETYFSWRWHPYAVDATKDYSTEETTLVAFELEDVEGGTLLTVVESGFDNIPVERRMEAYRMNSGGWDIQVENISKHVTAKT